MHNPEHAQWFASLGSDFMDKVSNFDYSFFGLDLGQTPTFALNWLILVPILSGATSLFVSILSMKMSPNGQQQQAGMMKGMMYGSLCFPFFLPSPCRSVSVSTGSSPTFFPVSSLSCSISSIIPKSIRRNIRPSWKKKRLSAERNGKNCRQRKLDRGEELSDEDLTEEELKKKKVKTSARTEEEEKAARAKAEEEYLTAKEINRRRLAEAVGRMRKNTAKSTPK